jgi:hypothetical protein
MRAALCIALVALGLAGCPAPEAQPQQPATPKSGEGRREAPMARVEGLRTSGEVAAALQAAERAYMAGDWGNAVVQANRVLEGAASPEEFYAAVKILGLASCNRRDERPAAHALKRLQPEDREHLRSACEQNGIKLPEAP